MNLRRILALSALLSIFITGCAPTVKMSQENRDMIKAVAVSDDITVPTEMYYFGKGQNVGLLFGPVGAVIAAKAARKPAEEIAQFAKDNGILIDQIVRDEFTKQLASSGKFGISKNAPADAELQMNIGMYGLSIPNGFSSKFIPVLLVEAKMINPSGETVWQDRKRIFGTKLTGYTMEEIRSNPENLRQSWQAAAKVVAEELIEKM